MADAQDTDAQDTTDPLEAELRSYPPVAPSRAVAENVARALAGEGRRVRPWRLFAGAAAALAACLVGAVAVWHVSHSSDHSAPGNIVSLATHPATSATKATGGNQLDDDRPSLASYRRALSRSPEAVDELLDRHAARLLPGGRDDYTTSTRVSASTGLEMLR